MSSVRIMPCLDIKEGRVVKGLRFVNLRDAGDPVLTAKAYVEDGADELTFLDITATIERRQATLEVVRQVAAVVTIPFTVGGGVGSVSDAEAVLEAGADRVSVSSAVFRDPDLIDRMANAFGSEKVVVAVDVDSSRRTPSGYEVYVDGGRTPTGQDVISWAKEVADRGAGMILPTSKTRDGARQGYDISLIKKLKQAVSVPIVASGGAGALDHFLDAAQAGADVLLAASVFHFGHIRISQLKQYLNQHGVATK